jgi:hypothetical protein
MNPQNHKSVETTDKSVQPTDELMTWLVNTKTACELQRDRLEYRAARNMRLVKGLPVEDQSIVSNVRKRRKLYFRKIWSSGYRILASMYQAFLQDMNQVKLEGRDEDKDPAYARVLQKLVEYYRDRLMRRRSLFVQFLWNFLDIIFIGDTNGKLYWRYNEESGDDYLDYKAYPMEQVGRDYTAVIPDEMRYYYFENYMVKDQLEDEGYDNIEQAQPCSVKSSPLRSVRYFKSPDPLMNVSQNPETNYPESGTGAQPSMDQHLQLYRTVEYFWKKNGKWQFAIINPEGRVWFKKPMLSPYGDAVTLITGSMLLESHKATGEGLPEPAEGPQESLNYNINVRKDNVDMALRVRPVYDRDANVDVAALLDHRTGLPIGVDGDVNSALKFDRPPDVTQSSYVEASQDVNIIDEYGGTNPTKMGNTNVDKTGVAQINQSEGGAKIDLFIATVAETFFRQWYYVAAQHVSKFCTDEKAIRIANESLRREDPKALPSGKTLYDLEDLDVDVIVEVGIGTVGRQVLIQQTSAFIGQAIQANNVAALMLKSGVTPPEGLTLLNVSKMLIDLAPSLGIKNVKDYEIPLGAPQQAQQPGQDSSGAVGQKAAGQSAPQPNDDAGLNDVLQRVFTHGEINANFPKGAR